MINFKCKEGARRRAPSFFRSTPTDGSASISLDDIRMGRTSSLTESAIREMMNVPGRVDRKSAPCAQIHISEPPCLKAH